MSVISKLRNLKYTPETVTSFILWQLALVWLCSFGVTVWAWALTKGPYDPMPSIKFQVEVAAKLSISTTLLSLVAWIFPVVRARRMSYLKALLIAGVGTELVLTLRALVCSEVIFHWDYSSRFVYQFVSPSLFFAEYNFLTYIFEVGPLVSISVVLLTWATMWIAKRMPFKALPHS